MVRGGLSGKVTFMPDLEPKKKPAMERSGGGEMQADRTACANTLSGDRRRTEWVEREAKYIAKKQQRALSQESGLSLSTMASTEGFQQRK